VADPLLSKLLLPETKDPLDLPERVVTEEKVVLNVPPSAAPASSSET